MKTAVCTGSFDPITLGHLDIIRRAAACFDHIYVCISPNASKRSQMFAPEEKLRLARAAIADIPNAEAELYNGLVADYARVKGASVIVRGVRDTGDFNTECQMARINRELNGELETLLLPASAEYEHFSSSMVREMIRYRQPLEKYLPAAVVALMREMRKEEMKYGKQ